MKWSEMSEIFAGRTWYKWAIAKVVELAAIPAYLLSFGHVLFFPVDLNYFILAWLLRTAASGMTYTTQLVSLGKSFLTGFWVNPRIELSFLAGYLRASVRQWLDRPQYGTFMATVGGTGAVIPSEYFSLLRSGSYLIRASLAVTSTFLLMGGLASWLLFPLGAVGLVSGLSLLRNGYNANNRGRLMPLGRQGLWQRVKRPLMVAAGVAAAAIGGTALALGLPVLLTNYLSIAVIVNLSFGAYLMSLLSSTVKQMKKAIQEKADPVAQKQLEKNKFLAAELQPLANVAPSTFSTSAKTGQTIITVLQSQKFLDGLAVTDAIDTIGDVSALREAFKGNWYLSHLPDKTVERIFEVLKHYRGRRQAILDDLVAFGYVTVTGTETKNGRTETTYAVTGLVKAGANQLYNTLLQYQGNDRTLATLAKQKRGGELVQRTWNMLWDRLPISLELQDEEHPEDENNRQNLVLRYRKMAQEILAVRDRNNPVGPHLMIPDLLSRHAELRDMLRQIEVIDASNNIHQGAEHPYRVFSHYLLELLYTAELTIVNQAGRRLQANNADQEAIAALRHIVSQTREFVVVHTASILYRRYRLSH